MRASAHTFVTVLAVGAFFALVYVAYLCMYLAPVGQLRNWGATRWWVLFLFGPAWPKEVLGFSGVSRLRYHTAAPAAAPAAAAGGQRTTRAGLPTGCPVSMMTMDASDSVP